MKRNLTNRFSKFIKAYSLLVCFLFICSFGFSNRERPGKDILYYNGDTLQVLKIHVDLILKKIKQQNAFIGSKSAVRGNRYTAHWKIESNKLYLIKITNRYSLTDTLDLKRAFGKKFENGRVKLTGGNKILLATDRKLVRDDRFFGTFFLTDYHFEIKRGNIFNVDSVVHYIDDPNRLDRKTSIDMTIYLYKLVVNKTVIKQTDSLLNYNYVHMDIVFDTEGKLVSFYVYPFGTGDESDTSIEPMDSLSYFFDFSNVEEELKKLVWDEMPGMFNDVISFYLRYSEELKRLTGQWEGADRALYRYF